MDLKRCITCGLEKPKSEFYKHPTGKDGYRNDCKACFLVKSHEKYRSLMEDSKGKVPSQPRRVYSEAYYAAHKEEIIAREKVYEEAHKEVIAQRKADKIQADKAKREAYQAAHPRMYWTERTVGHHGLTGRKIRHDILAMSEQTAHCPICHCELKYSGGETAPHSASLDNKQNDKNNKRIDNFWIVCLRCNYTKRDRSMEEMDAWCLQWQKVRQGRSDKVQI